MKTQKNRRDFIKDLSLGIASVSTVGLMGVNYISAHPFKVKEGSEDLFFKISLAQWSLHKAFESGKLNPADFASIAKNQFGIEAIEYVNANYLDHAKDEKYWNTLKTRARNEGVESLLIMVDDEGKLGNTNDNQRAEAVENHLKWVDAAKMLGCHSIRVNAFGEGSAEEVSSALVDGLGKLASYAKKEGINVLLENHGLFSSDAKWVINVIKQVGMDNCGTLPDFGNFCLTQEWGSTYNNDCEKAYDRYLGVKEMMPFAKGVSAKSYDFDADGNQTIIDYQRMVQVVYDAGFKGYIGIEYEGDKLSEPEGILATKKLLEKVGMSITR